MTGVRLAVALAAVVTGRGLRERQQPTPTSRANGEPRLARHRVSKGYPLPDLPFTDTEGQQVTPRTWRGHR